MDDAPTPIDIVNCYRLALGREPESPAVVEDKLGHSRTALLPDFFSSGEFRDKVRAAAAASGPLRGGIFQSPPSADLLDWTAGFAPLSAPGREALQTCRSWYGLYLALFADPLFQQSVLTPEDQADNPAFLAALDARVQVEGLSNIKARIELVTSAQIRGWAVDMSAPNRRVALQLLVDGVVAAATVTEVYRADVQAEFGGDGRVGFVLSRSGERGRTGGAAEVREAASGLLLQSFHLPAGDEPPMDAALAMRKELAELRRLLERIEARLPDFNEAFSYSLDAYDAYFERYYATPPAEDARPEDAPAGPREALPLAVIVDATEAGPSVLEAALASLWRQPRGPAAVVVVHPGGDLQLEYDALLQAWRGRAGGIPILHGVPAMDGAWAAALQAAEAPQLVILQARARLARGSLQAVSDVLADGAAFAFADGDEIELRADGSVVRHARPRFRTAFDYDLLLQQADLGDMLGLQCSAALALGLKDDLGPAAALDLVLRHVEAQGDQGITHIPRILAHSTAAATPAADGVDRRAEIVRAHLGRMDVDALVSPHQDELGATIEGALRVRRRLPAAARAAVIIPTRDRLDLLGPCLASLIAAASKNRARMEILLVDNASTAPVTRTFLETFARLAPMRVVEHDGVFNWALMNNRAAAQTDAEVLIFLNNDTLVLTPDWCDELCSQALRPEVGAVGARLLYEDGTLQHAGVVMGGWHSFAAHEGVGDQGSDPGYLGRHALLRRTAAVTGACLATRAEVFRALQGFDALNLPVESNDVDYCLRARAQGLQVLYDPYCTLFHFESKSRGMNVDPDKRRMAEAAGAFMRTRWQPFRNDPFYNPHFDRLSSPFQRLTAPPASCSI